MNLKILFLLGALTAGQARAAENRCEQQLSVHEEVSSRVSLFVNVLRANMQAPQAKGYIDLLAFAAYLERPIAAAELLAPPSADELEKLATAMNRAHTAFRVTVAAAPRPEIHLRGIFDRAARTAALFDAEFVSAGDGAARRIDRFYLGVNHPATARVTELGRRLGALLFGTAAKDSTKAYRVAIRELMAYPGDASSNVKQLRALREKMLTVIELLLREEFLTDSEEDRRFFEIVHEALFIEV